MKTLPIMALLLTTMVDAGCFRVSPLYISIPNFNAQQKTDIQLTTKKESLTTHDTYKSLNGTLCWASSCFCIPSLKKLLTKKTLQPCSLLDSVGLPHNTDLGLPLNASAFETQSIESVEMD